MAKSPKTSFGRRSFLKTAGGAAALATTSPALEAQSQRSATEPAPSGVPAPTERQIERETGNIRPPAEVRKITRPGSDLMVQTLKDLGVEYVAANPGDRKS